MPSLYIAHEREVFARDGMLYAVSDFVELIDGPTKNALRSVPLIGLAEAGSEAGSEAGKEQSVPARERHG